jgi:hypothetical protein
MLVSFADLTGVTGINARKRSSTGWLAVDHLG